MNSVLYVVVLASISICLRYLVFLYKGKLIGEGGYAEVYKGQLEDGQFVASKRLTRGSPEEMTVDFLSVPGIIVHVDHPNIAKMFPGPKEKLDWRIRCKIALGTAQGLLFQISGLQNGYQRSDEKTNIYAYGVLLLEPITVRQALDSSQQSLVMWAKPLLMKNSIKELVVPTLGDAYDSEQMDPR
ncbi:hypothetical protein POTOM_030548 [Populus tomentosa]|uniref:Protein kinase domain-containing protein n=1 Tax=Populus tomentosa TaxID=118781 RepID=A0A8X7ZNH2_POPTO|nr:hypothetical protein POTOM_030548 [Populus tomentosa]